jgi:hypothetical protein
VPQASRESRPVPLERLEQRLGWPLQLALAVAAAVVAAALQPVAGPEQKRSPALPKRAAFDRHPRHRES